MRQTQGDLMGYKMAEDKGQLIADIANEGTAALERRAKSQWADDPLDLSGAKLQGVKLARANLSRANFRGADLRGADLESATMTGAILIGANLSGAFLEFVDLSGANLKGTDLEDASLKRATLQNAYLVRATLTDTIMCNCDITGVDFTDVYSFLFALGLERTVGEPMRNTLTKKESAYLRKVRKAYEAVHRSR